MANGTAGAREAALYVLARCRRFDAWSQQTIQTAAEKFSLDERDTALCTKLCLDVLQNAALCDYYIGCYSSVPAAKLEPNLLDILRLGVCQLLFMDKIPVSAAVNEAVEQTKRSGSRAAGLVNAVLRRVAENRENLPEIPNIGTAQELSVRFSHPLWLCERMVSELGYDGAHAFFAASNRAPQLMVSVNTRYGDAPSLVERFTAAGVRAHLSELSSVSVCVEDKGSAAALPGFAAGEFFVQDAAAAMSVLCAAPQKGMRVLDACSAPGGKSLLCASLMENDGEILACDLHEKKLRLVEENAERLGFSIIRTAPMDASKTYEALRGSFDLVIADVPCSGMGVIRKKPEITGEKSAAFQLMSEREIPEELKEWMEQEKAHPFMLTYAVEQDIYAARSYGPQNKTGYQIKVDAVLEGEKTVRIQTSLLGPEKGEKTKDVVTYPYVVVKLKKTEKEILFE